MDTACAASQCQPVFAELKDSAYRPECCASLKLRKGEEEFTALLVTAMVASQIIGGAEISSRGINRYSQ